MNLNVHEVVKAGTDCIAVVSAICAAHDPEAAARRINDIICSALTVPNILINIRSSAEILSASFGITRLFLLSFNGFQCPCGGMFNFFPDK